MIRRVMVPHAALKVFEPVEAFSVQEQAYWRSYASSGASPASDTMIVLSREQGIRSPIVTRTAEREQAETIEINGRLYVCPLRTRLRLLASIVSFSRTIPTEVVPAFMPEDEAERAADELERMQAEHPGWRSHILLSTWEVPLRWFCAFEASERLVGRSAIRYRAGVADARARVTRALAVLRSALPDPTVVGMVAEVGRWLTHFHDEAILELDYGSVANLFEPGALAEDCSAEDIQAAVAALAEGEPDRAGAFYSRAAERWAGARGLENTN